MKIRNNTSKKLVLYVGNPHFEEPEAVKELKVGEDVETMITDKETISIQDK